MNDNNRNSIKGIMQYHLEDAADVDSIVIDENKEQKERVRDYLKQVKNPYLLRVGKVLVQLEYVDTQYSFNDRYKSVVADMIS